MGWPYELGTEQAYAGGISGPGTVETQVKLGPGARGSARNGSCRDLGSVQGAGAYNTQSSLHKGVRVLNPSKLAFTNHSPTAKI